MVFILAFEANKTTLAIPLNLLSVAIEMNAFRNIAFVQKLKT